MKRISRLYLLLFLPIVFAACSEKDGFTEPVKQYTEIRVEAIDSVKQDNAIKEARLAQRSKAEVIAIASGLFGISNEKIRGDEFEVKGVLMERNIKLRSVSSEYVKPVDTVFYVLNRRNKSGYALISGDKRLANDLLSYSENGSLNMENISPESGLAVFMSRLPGFYEMELQRLKDENGNEHPDDYWTRYRELILEPLPGAFKYHTHVEYTKWEVDEEVEPLISVKWNQSYPYNNNAKIINGKRALAGCVTTAVAQLLSRYNYPYKYKGQYLDWSFLKKHKHYTEYTSQESERFNAEIAQLFRNIGDALHNSWGLEGTSASEKSIPKVLKEMGYAQYSKVTKYKNAAEVIKSLRAGCPVVMSGFSEPRGIYFWKINIDLFPVGGGHTWLCDGYKEISRTRKVRIKDEYGKVVRRYDTEESQTLLHCNWGWGGNSDGYFYPGVFDSNKPIEKDDDKLRHSKRFYYEFDITNILNCRP